MPRSWTSAQLLETTRAFQPACIISAAAELDLFTLLGDAPATSEGLAARMEANPRGLAILLDALVAIGLLTKRDQKYGVEPDVVELLCECSPTNVLAAVRHQANCLRRWVQLARVVLTGEPAGRTPSTRGEAADREAFIGAMNVFTASVAPQMVAKLEPLRFQRLLDVGGASGTWTVAFLRAVPDATAVLFDLPDVVPLARDRLTRAGLADRVTLVPGDYHTDELPGGADFAWLSAIAHQNSPDQNRALYRKIHSALVAGGTLVIRDIVMDADRTSPPAGALFGVNMLVNTTGGNACTLDEFTEDLKSVGFGDVELVCRDDLWMNSLIRARKS